MEWGSQCSHPYMNGSSETRRSDGGGEPPIFAKCHSGSVTRRAGVSATTITNNGHHHHHHYVKKPKYRTIITIGEGAKSRTLERQGGLDTGKATAKRNHLSQSDIDHMAKSVNNAHGGIASDNGGASRQPDTGRCSATAAGSWGRYVYMDGAAGLPNGTSMKGSAVAAPETNGIDHRETFHVSEHVISNGYRNGAANGDAGSALNDDDEHPFDVSTRDIRNPKTLKETKIVSAKGTVRGIKNRVRAGIATFLESNGQDGQKKRNYAKEERGLIILYATSMMIVRGTCENCKKVRQMLQTHMVQYEERDIFMSKENQRELLERLGTTSMDVPQVFANGQHLGGIDELERLNESGELRDIFKYFKRVSRMTSCETCGGYRYIPCTTCHGSKKSLHRNHFTEEFCALRCIVCDENGLIKCDSCSDNTAAPSTDL